MTRVDYYYNCKRFRLLSKVDSFRMFDGPRNWEVLFRLARSLSKSSKPEVSRAQLLKFSWHGIKAHGPEFSENKLYGLIAAASSMIQKEKDSIYSIKI